MNSGPVPAFELTAARERAEKFLFQAGAAYAVPPVFDARAAVALLARDLLSALDENERRVIEIKGVRSDRKKLLDENEGLREALRAHHDFGPGPQTDAACPCCGANALEEE